ncbi:MAG: MarR family transcriptional regulator [Pseudomonadota bacterium]
MRRIHANLHPKAQAVDSEKVGQLGGMILMTIQDLEPIMLRDLSDHLSRDKAQMARHVQMLERKNLILRTTSKEDGRKILIRLSERGNDLVSSFQRALSEVIEEMLPDTDKAELEQFSSVIRKMIQAKNA